MKSDSGKKRRRTWAILAGVCLAVLLLPHPSLAEIKFWVGSSSRWDYSSNWSPTGQPQGSDDVYLTQSDGTNRTVLYYNTAYPSAVLNFLIINASSSGTMTLNQEDFPLASDIEYVGMYHSGKHLQSGGTNYIGNYLSLGFQPNGSGTYELSGTGSLSAWDQDIGHFGIGAFIQTGGTNICNNELILGNKSGSSGTYKLSGGSLSAFQQYIGKSGTGVFEQNGGVNTVSTELHLGYDSGSSGTYELSNTGTLSASLQYIGYSGTGIFKQTGGTNSPSPGRLYLGYNPGSNGAYELSGGSLLVAVQYIGYSGTGIFKQTGGINSLSLGKLYLGYSSGSNGTYELSSGSLSAMEQFIGYGGTGAFIQTGVTNTVRNGLYLGYNPGSIGVYELSATGSLSTDETLVGYYGNGTFIQSGGTHNVNKDLIVSTTNTSSGAYYMSGGILSTHETLVRASGSSTFTQIGGIHTTNYLTLGMGSQLSKGEYYLSGTGSVLADKLTVGQTGTGFFNQSGGSLSSQNQFIGRLWGSSGTFKQTGGTNTVSDDIYLGYYSGSSGAYELSGTGSLSGKNQYVGYSGSGTFKQTGGTNTFSDNIYLGYDYGSSGTYELSGGTNEVTLLTLGYSYNSNGIYKLSGTGSLNVKYLLIGDIDTGIFTQSGGVNTVSDTLTVSGVGSFGSGTYNLQGGSLSANTIEVNYHGAFNVLNTTTTVTGDVINSGTVKTTNANVTWAGTFTNLRAYISDPATQTFNNLTVGSTGYLQGGAGDTFIISQDFINQSAENVAWNTLGALLKFAGGGPHELYLPGTDLGKSMAGYTENFAWGILDMTGQILSLNDGNAVDGGALYVGEILGLTFGSPLITNIYGNGFNIYYDPSLLGNEYLGGLTYALLDGGQLAPTPLPGSAWLLLSGLAGLGIMGRSWKRKKT